MIFRVLDIETIPDPTVWTPGEAQWKVVPTSREHGNWDAQVAEVEPFPAPQAHRVVAVAWIDITMDIDPSVPRYRFTDAYTTCKWCLDPRDTKAADEIEESILGAFSTAMKCQSGITLVTWNGRGFDLPVLSMRSLKQGISFGWYYDNRGMRYRYSDEGHLDLMDFLGDYGAARNMKLNDMAHLIGLPGKTDMTGASVHDIVKSTHEVGLLASNESQRKMDSVGRYCLQDAIQTALIFLRTRFHLGKIDRDEYHRCMDTFYDPTEARSQIIKDAIDIDWPRHRILR